MLMVVYQSRSKLLENYVFIKDISELNLPSSCTMTFPNGKDNLMNFEVSIRPDEGYYLGGTFLFSFQVSRNLST
ncbi:hypothetical protein OIU78_020487 [Salix suchowensis]|nr:hypothetical protein OIU78_020487 [Salix suchowensis]